MKIQMLLAAAAAAAFVCCGDDDDAGEMMNSSNNNAAANNGNNNNASASANNNSANNSSNNTAAVALDTIYDCSGNASITSCDVAACAIDSAYEALRIACSSNNAPIYCGDVLVCFGTYSNCIQSVCPAGTQIDSANSDAVQTCGDDYQTCVDTAVGD